MRQQHVRGIAWSASYSPLIALIPLAFWCFAFLAVAPVWAAAPAAPTHLTATAHLFQGENSERKEIAAINNLVANEIIEMAIPFELLGVKLYCH